MTREEAKYKQVSVLVRIGENPRLVAHLDSCVDKIYDYFEERIKELESEIQSLHEDAAGEDL